MVHKNGKKQHGGFLGDLRKKLGDMAKETEKGAKGLADKAKGGKKLGPEAERHVLQAAIQRDVEGELKHAGEIEKLVKKVQVEKKKIEKEDHEIKADVKKEKKEEKLKKGALSEVADTLKNLFGGRKGRKSRKHKKHNSRKSKKGKRHSRKSKKGKRHSRKSRKGRKSRKH